MGWIGKVHACALRWKMAISSRWRLGACRKAASCGTARRSSLSRERAAAGGDCCPPGCCVASGDLARDETVARESAVGRNANRGCGGLLA
jgi:hypothetical protein